MADALKKHAEAWPPDAQFRLIPLGQGTNVVHAFENELRENFDIHVFEIREDDEMETLRELRIALCRKGTVNPQLVFSLSPTR
jgi:hypothetical protein